MIYQTKYMKQNISHISNKINDIANKIYQTKYIKNIYKK